MSDKAAHVVNHPVNCNCSMETTATQVLLALEEMTHVRHAMHDTLCR